MHSTLTWSNGRLWREKNAKDAGVEEQFLMIGV